MTANLANLYRLQDSANMCYGQSKISTVTEGKTWIRVLAKDILSETKDHIDILKYARNRLEYVLADVLAQFYSKSNRSAANKNAKNQVIQIIDDTLFNFRYKGNQFSNAKCTAVSVNKHDYPPIITISFKNSANIQYDISFNIIRPSQTVLREGTVLTCISTPFRNLTGIQHRLNT
eukprot:66781_1